MAVETGEYNGMKFQLDIAKDNSSVLTLNYRQTRDSPLHWEKFERTQRAIGIEGRIEVTNPALHVYNARLELSPLHLERALRVLVEQRGLEVPRQQMEDWIAVYDRYSATCTVQGMDPYMLQGKFYFTDLLIDVPKPEEHSTRVRVEIFTEYCEPAIGEMEMYLRNLINGNKEMARRGIRDMRSRVTGNQASFWQ